MVRSLRIGTLVAVLSCVAPILGQAVQQERFIMVREDGKPAQKCKVLKSTKEKDGSVTSQVQVVSTGEVMTILEEQVKFGKAPAKSRLFAWGKNQSRENLVPIQVVSEVTKITRSDRDIPVVKAEIEPAKPTSADLRQSWGKVERGTKVETKTLVGKTTVKNEKLRSPLPLSKTTGTDPMERQDLFGKASIPGQVVSNFKAKDGEVVKKSESKPVVKDEPVPASKTVVKPVVKEESTPTSKPVAKSVVKEDTVSTSKASVTSTGPVKTEILCNECPSKDKKLLPPQPVARKEKESQSLIGRLMGNRRNETLITTSTGETIIVSEPRKMPVETIKTSVPVTKPVREVKEPRVEVVRNKTPLLPVNEGRVGVFAGLQTGESKRAARQSSKGNPSEMPAGMSSVAAANQAAVSQQTSMGSLVRTPDGQSMVVPSQNVPPQMPSVPINAANAFTMTMPTAPVMAEAIQKGPNAFSMTSPVRPVPADYGQSTMVPNAFYAGATPAQDPRMGGGMPAMAAMQGYQNPGNQAMPVAGYMANPNAYAPPAMAGYGIATVGYTGGGAPVGMAMASDMSSGMVGGCLLTLRQSILPSEREKAAETLCQMNWKSDPQIVPALVMAAKSDPAPMVRVSCIRALGHMKANSAPTVEAIKTLKNDSDARVRQAVEQVLPVLMQH